MIVDDRRWWLCRRAAWLNVILGSAILGSGIFLLIPSLVIQVVSSLAVALALAASYRLQTKRFRRRRRLLENISDNDSWHQFLVERVGWYRRLDSEDQNRMRDCCRIFLSEVPIVGVGCEITGDDKRLVAASAVIPILGFPGWEYHTLRAVLIRPSAFNPHFGQESEPGSVQAADGLAGHGGLFTGTIILALDSLRRGFRNDLDGDNVGIHEFMHLIDAGNGEVDGLPAGMCQETLGPWRHAVAAAFAKNRSQRLLRQYGYTNTQEFLAVLGEQFFENPQLIERRNPELYELLCRIFRQRPQAVAKTGS